MENEMNIEEMCHNISDMMFGKMTLEQLEQFKSMNISELSNCENEAERQACKDIISDIERIIEEKKKN